MGKSILKLILLQIKNFLILKNINTFSKSLSPTIRISYMVLPPKLANLFYNTLSFYSCTVSNFEQYTLATFIKEGYFEKHINRMRLYYSRQRKELMNILSNSSLKDHIEIIENESGLHFIIRLKTNLSDKTVYNTLLKNKIKLVALSRYYQKPDKTNEHLFLINYSNLDMKKMPSLCETIASLIFK